MGSYRPTGLQGRTQLLVRVLLPTTAALTSRRPAVSWGPSVLSLPAALSVTSRACGLTRCPLTPWAVDVVAMPCHLVLLETQPVHFTVESSLWEIGAAPECQLCHLLCLARVCWSIDLFSHTHTVCVREDDGVTLISCLALKMSAMSQMAQVDGRGPEVSASPMG